MQRAPHIINPVPHVAAQTPRAQIIVPGQARAQPPQLALSDKLFTQVPAHAIKPGEHVVPPPLSPPPPVSVTIGTSVTLPESVPTPVSGLVPVSVTTTSIPVVSAPTTS